MFDFLLLLTVKIVLKKKVKCYRILLASFFGAFSIFFLFLKLNSITLFLLKVIISLIMIIISFGITSINEFIKNTLYLYFVSIILGGFLYYLNLEFSYDNIGLIFINNGFSINIKQDKNLKIINNYYYQVDIYYKNFKKSYNAYLDTGNKLYDPYFKKPIILLYDKNFPKIENPIYVPYKTLDHTGLLECIRVDKIVLDNEKTIKKPFVALSKDKLKMDDVQVLLHKDYLE